MSRLVRLTSVRSHLSKVLLLILLCPLASHASFDQTSKRYLGPRDLFNQLVQHFPVLNRKEFKTETLNPSCWTINSANRDLIGAIHPAIGKAPISAPTPNMVRWLATCANEIVQMQVQELKDKQTEKALWQKYFPSAFLGQIRDKDSRQEPYRRFFDKSWAELDPETRAGIVTHLLMEFIGPEPLWSKELTASLAALSKQRTQALVEVIPELILAIMLREDFYTY